MIANPFVYQAPSSLDEVFTMLEDGSAKILAGGMSLIPLMKLRLASPENVIDLRRVPGLKEIAESGGVWWKDAPRTDRQGQGASQSSA